MERQDAVRQRPHTKEATGAASESTHAPACTACGAETPLEDQFLSDAGALCPACHLAAPDPSQSESAVALFAGGVVRAMPPTLMAWISVGLTQAWLEASIGGTVAMVVGIVLGAVALLYGLGSAAGLRGVTWGPIADLQSPMVRATNGAGAFWALLCSLVTAASLTWLLISMV